MFKLTIDTREPHQEMEDIARAQIIARKLDATVKSKLMLAGDYLVKFSNGFKSYYERKTLSDFISSIIPNKSTNISRMRKQFDDMIQTDGYQYLIIEFNGSDRIMRDTTIGKGNFRSNAVLGQIYKWMASGMCVIYTENKADTIRTILDISIKQYKFMNKGKRSIPHNMNKFKFLVALGLSDKLARVLMHIPFIDIIRHGFENYDKLLKLKYPSGIRVSESVIKRRMRIIRNMPIGKVLSSIYGVGDVTALKITSEYPTIQTFGSVTVIDILNFINTIRTERSKTVATIAEYVFFDTTSKQYISDNPYVSEMKREATLNFKMLTYLGLSEKIAHALVNIPFIDIIGKGDNKLNAWNDVKYLDGSSLSQEDMDETYQYLLRKTTHMLAESLGIRGDVLSKIPNKRLSDVNIADFNNLINVVKLNYSKSASLLVKLSLL